MSGRARRIGAAARAIGYRERVKPAGDEGDLANGRIRLPREAKALFPAGKSGVSIILRGQPMEVRYDPRVGPDQERSAVLGIGRGVLPTLVREDEVRQLRALADGIVELG